MAVPIRRDLQIIIHHQKPFAGGFNDSPKFFLTFSEFFLCESAFGNVDNDTLIEAFVAGGVPDDGGLIFNPADIAITGDDSVKLGVFLDVFSGIFFNFCDCSFTVIRMHDIFEDDLSAQKTIGRIPEA
jgi:hypothetical protein